MPEWLHGHGKLPEEEKRCMEWHAMAELNISKINTIHEEEQGEDQSVTCYQ